MLIVGASMGAIPPGVAAEGSARDVPQYGAPPALCEDESELQYHFLLAVSVDNGILAEAPQPPLLAENPGSDASCRAPNGAFDNAIECSNVLLFTRLVVAWTPRYGPRRPR
jgi:hypothetical protein